MIQLVSDDKLKQLTLEEIRKYLDNNTRLDFPVDPIFNIMRQQVLEYALSCNHWQCYVVFFYDPRKPNYKYQTNVLAKLLRERCPSITPPKVDKNSLRCHVKYFRTLKSVLKFLFNSKPKVLLQCYQYTIARRTRPSWYPLNLEYDKYVGGGTTFGRNIGIVSNELNFKVKDVLESFQANSRKQDERQEKYWCQLTEDTLFCNRKLTNYQREEQYILKKREYRREKAQELISRYKKQQKKASSKKWWNWFS